MAPNMPGWAHPYQDPSVWYADGAGDPAPDPEPVPEPDAEPDAEPEPVEDWQPPTREQWDRLQSEKAKASAEAANRRKWMRAAGLDPKTGKKLEPDPEPDPVPAPRQAQDPDAPAPGLSEADAKRLVDKAVAEAQLKGVRQMRTFTVGFNEELAKAGWNGTRLGHLMKLLDLDAIDIDDDGEITGLAEQIDDLKTEWPEFFKRNRATTSKPGGGTGQSGTPAANVDVADKKPPAPQPKGWAEQVAEKLVRG